MAMVEYYELKKRGGEGGAIIKLKDGQVEAISPFNNGSSSDALAVANSVSNGVVQENAAVGRWANEVGMAIIFGVWLTNLAAMFICVERYYAYVSAMVFVRSTWLDHALYYGLFGLVALGTHFILRAVAVSFFTSWGIYDALTGELHLPNGSVYQIWVFLLRISAKVFLFLNYLTMVVGVGVLVIIFLGSVADKPLSISLVGNSHLFGTYVDYARQNWATLPTYLSFGTVPVGGAAEMIPPSIPTTGQQYIPPVAPAVGVGVAAGVGGAGPAWRQRYY